ncbi:MAG: DDE-type integrase/transposase/recombinase [Magnetovibrio sp.]|nr:DDE-type integrase/transposase/recombinase [Magnetovibrio sp.]
MPKKQNDTLTHRNTSKGADLSEIPKDKWETALRRQDEIEALLHLKDRTEADVIAAAKRLNCSRTWLYELITRYEAAGTVSCLVPKNPTGGSGKGRIDPVIEEIIEKVIDELYLTRQKLRPFHIVRAVQSRCRDLNLKPPANNTIRARIKTIPGRVAMKHRESGHKARDVFDPAIGEFPPPKWPLGVVQMDHTKSDIIIVDEEHREPIGRAYCTAAIDIYSRAVLGFHLSLEAPSAMTVGLCLTHAVLPKQRWLKERGIEAEWPMWGKPDVLHVDNGADFRSEALRRGCEEYGISLQYRPIKHPRYGGTIERLFRTLGQEIHALPGTTFSNIQDRGEYDSDKHAALTLAELERILVLVITGQYHEKRHSSLLMSPKKAFEIGIYGQGEELGRGLPESITDERKFLIDFLPMKRRSIQKYGIVWDHVHYYDDVLRTYIDRQDRRQLIVRRDPRDISKIFFQCPENKEYLEIPYRNISRPSISLWEANAARERLKKIGDEHLDEEKIFQTYDKIQEELDVAQGRTKSARRSKERKKQNTRSIKRNPTSADQSRSQKSITRATAVSIDVDFDDRFDEIEDW